MQKRRERPAVQIRDAESGHEQEQAQNKGRGRQRCLTCDCSHLAVAPAPRANDGTWTQRGGPARTALVNQKLQCSAAHHKSSIKCAPAPATPPDWPPQRAWLRVPEVRWGDLRPPVFPASLEQLRASKLAKLPQVHKRLPPTRAAA